MTSQARHWIHRLTWAATLLCAPVAWAQEHVAQTVHNLSVSGPGTVRAQSEGEICIFCHAPHNTAGARPLWNRELSVGSYAIYESSTLDANPGQPTGSSKLCLSCHDGTIALGSVLSRTQRIQMAGGDFLPAGLTNLGTDLSDDHPIGFAYTSGLAAADQQLANPSALPPQIKLDNTGELHCTACHDPHHNVYGQFLVMSNEYGALCTACHVMDGWSAASHQSSGASVLGADSGDWPYTTVAQNACRSCHRSHTAGGHERLLHFEEEEENCLNCHDGQVASKDIQSEINKLSAHDPRRYTNQHDPIETPSTAQPHVECFDCHNAHAATAQSPEAGYVPIGATLARVGGVTSGGNSTQEAQYEYEVCFRCHGDSPVPVTGRILRTIDQPNLRLKFNPSSMSFHPVVTAASNTDTISLVAGLPIGSMIRCTDCHNNDSGPRAGGSGPDGPHGSIYDFLLEENYNTRDDTPESAFEYALCYKCHRRQSILGDESFSEHKKHIEDENTPCSACHDPHGVSTVGGGRTDRTHLINFDATIVRPLDGIGQPEFVDLGPFRGSCTLTCHGEDHDNEEYPDD